MCKSYSKTCLKCGSGNTKKDGKRKGRQSYRCKKCGYIWINKSRKKTKVDIEALYKSFSNHKQTYRELAKSKRISIKTVQKYLDMKVINRSKIKPRKVALLVDTTYFGTFGFMLFKDAKKKDIIKYKIVDYETNDEYRKGIEELLLEGWEIEAIVSDGRRGLLGMFNGIPSQMCHFHQKQIIRRYIKKPILKSNIELNEIVKSLHKTDKGTFESMIEKRYKKYKNWLHEKGVNSKGKYYYIHKKTRSAYLYL